MGILNTPGEIWQNVLAIIVVFFVFFWVYKNMQDTPFKRWIADTIEKIKEVIRNGN